MKTQLEVGDLVYEIYNSKIESISIVTRVTKAQAFDETHRYCPISFWRSLDRRGALKRVGFPSALYYQYYLANSKLRARYKLQMKRVIVEKQLHEVGRQLHRLKPFHLAKIDAILDECRLFGLTISE